VSVGDAAEGGASRRSKSRGRRGVPAWARRTILAVVVAALLAGNAYVLKKQFPPAERQKNAAYDAGLRALDIDRDFATAEIQFRKYLEIDPHPARVRHLLGVALQYQGKDQEARAEYAKVLEQEPEFDEARVALAEMAMNEQAYEDAFRQLDLAKERDPTPTAVFVLRGRILAATGDQEGAVAAYRETLRRDPESYECAIELGDLLMARSVLGGSFADRQAAAGVYHDAEEVLRRRLANTQDKRLRLLLAKAISGQARVLQQRELSEAVAELRKAAELDPDDPEPALVLGGFFRAAGNLEEAERVLEDARRKWKKPRVYVAVFELYRDQRRTDDAIKVLRDAVGEWMDDASLRVRLVGYLAALGRLDEAEREADAAQQLFATDESVLAARGDLARERAVRAERDGDPEAAAAHRAKALAAYRRALEIRPRSLRLKKLVAGELIEGMVRRPPGSAMSDDEKFARAAIEDVLRVNARDAEALGWNARLLLVDGKSADVVKSLRPVLDSAAPPLDTLRILGAAAARIADHKLAAAAFTRVVELQRDTEREKSKDATGFGPPASDWWNAVHATLAAGQEEAAIELALVAVRLQPQSADLRRELGGAYLARGAAADAVKTLRQARTDFPADAGIRVLLARAWESSGRIDAAEEELKLAVVDLPGDLTRTAYFEFLARTGRAQAAEDGFLALVASDPDSPGGYLRLGDFYLSLDPPKTEAALAQYRRAFDLSKGAAGPALRIAELQLGLAAKSPEGFAEAEKSVESFAKTWPDDPWCGYLRGKLALAGGRPADAVPLLANFTELMPSQSAGHYYLAAALRAGGKTDEAVAALEKAAQLAPGDRAIGLELAVLRHEAGIKAFQRGDFAGAQRLFAAAEAGGAGRGSRLLLAGSQANAGDLELSEKETRKLLADEPRNQAALHLLAQIVLKKSSREALDEAEALYRRLLEIDPSDLLAKLGIGTVRYQRGEFRTALDVFREIYPKTNGAPSVAIVMAQCMTLLNDSAGAAEFLDGEVKARPDSDVMHHMKGDFLMHVRQPQDAVREFTTAFKLNPDNFGALLAASAALMELRDWDGAKKLLTESLPLVKAPGFVRLALGEVLMRSGRDAEAGDVLRQCLAESNQHPRALYLLGRLAEAAGQKSEAKRFYREATQRGVSDGDAYARLAQFSEAAGDRRAAIDLYAQALRFQPRSSLYLNNLAMLLADEDGRLEEAVTAALNANALAPDVPEIADTCGWLLFRAGRTKEAAARLEKAALQLKGDPVVQYHAGMAYSRLSRATDARDHLERALRLDPAFPGADAARAELEKLR
jgi:tetratricopeptide (TPR) repeat protein